MGKVRVKTLGDEESEREQSEKAQKRKEAKKVGKAPGLKGGERITLVGPSEEELEKLSQDVKEEIKEEKKPKKKAQKKKKQSARSKKYKDVKTQIDRSKIYPLQQALDLLPKTKLSNMDETVELHINTTDTGISGTVSLPHGTGKKTRVAIADDKLISEIEKGVVDFDVLVSSPQMMPKLARVAKYLGPRGLMPNPKNGTISQNPQEIVKKFEGGLIRFKTENKAPIIHISVGKLSFGEKKLTDNIQTLVKSINPVKIKNATIKSTMSPGIKVDIISL